MQIANTNLDFSGTRETNHVVTFRMLFKYVTGTLYRENYSIQNLDEI